MGSKRNNSISSTGTFTSVLLALFIYGKVTGQLDWSWLWVLSPFWIQIVAGALIGVIVGFIRGYRSVRQQQRKGGSEV